VCRDSLRGRINPATAARASICISCSRTAREESPACDATTSMIDAKRSRLLSSSHASASTMLGVPRILTTIPDDSLCRGAHGSEKAAYYVPE